MSMRSGAPQLRYLFGNDHFLSSIPIELRLFISKFWIISIISLEQKRTPPWEQQPSCRRLTQTPHCDKSTAHSKKIISIFIHLQLNLSLMLNIAPGRQCKLVYLLETFQHLTSKSLLVNLPPATWNALTRTLIIHQPDAQRGVIMNSINSTLGEINLTWWI